MLFKRFSSSSLFPLTIRQLLSPASDISISSQLPIQVHGWVKSVRRQKNVVFAVIRDGSSVLDLQAVLNPLLAPQNLTIGACVRMNGKLVRSQGGEQERELKVDTIDVIGDCDPESYPIQKQAMSVEYLRDKAHLRARTEAISAMLRLRDSTMKLLHRFFEEHNFYHVHTPILTSNDCEGAGETFRATTSSEEPLDDTGSTEFFLKPSYLTVSSQLHLEALSSALSRVYTLSPCFRAEPSQTNRHLAEFWMLEAEWAFTRKVDDVCQVAENCLKLVARQNSPEMSSLWKAVEVDKMRALEDAVNPNYAWSRLSYSDAVIELEKHQVSCHTFQYEPKWGKPLQSEHERWLAEQLIKGPVFVTDYPTSLKPFYTRRNDDGKTVACFDLLIPHIGELVGGSLREERLDVLQRSLDLHGLDREYGWYADLRQFGSAPHGGFGMGFERLISWISGIDNVRECIAMPRWAKRMSL